MNELINLKKVNRWMKYTILHENKLRDKDN